MNTFSVSATSRSYPELPYEQIKNDILGKTYELSLIFVGAAKAKQLNATYREKSYVPNVLSFPLSDTVGEIVIAPVVANKEAVTFNMTQNGYIGFLFIHGCLHLKGLDHGDTMDKAEQKYCKKYQLA
jgi:probable rRNA maturation factor